MKRTTPLRLIVLYPSVLCRQLSGLYLSDVPSYISTSDTPILLLFACLSCSYTYLCLLSSVLLAWTYVGLLQYPRRMGRVPFRRAGFTVVYSVMYCQSQCRYTQRVPVCPCNVYIESSSSYTDAATSARLYVLVSLPPLPSFVHLNDFGCSHAI